MGDVLRSVLDLSRRVTELEAQNSEIKAEVRVSQSDFHRAIDSTYCHMCAFVMVS
jgi:hypothetical protein